MSVHGEIRTRTSDALIIVPPAIGLRRPNYLNSYNSSVLTMTIRTSTVVPHERIERPLNPSKGSARYPAYETRW